MRYLAQELGPGGFRSGIGTSARTSCSEPAGRDPDDGASEATTSVCTPRKQPGFVLRRLLGPGRAYCTVWNSWSWPGWAETYGDGGVRIAHRPELICPAFRRTELDDLLAEPLIADLLSVPGALRRRRGVHRLGVCRFAVVETKERAVKWATGPGRPAGPRTEAGEHRDAGVIRMHFSGCSASCAQPQIADIGFRGDIAHVDEHIEEAVDIGFGGSLGPDAAFIDWLAGAVPVDRVPEALAPCRASVPG